MNDASFNTLYVPVMVFSSMIGILIYDTMRGRTGSSGPNPNLKRCQSSIRKLKTRHKSSHR
jgi:hypothetical protein